MKTAANVQVRQDKRQALVLSSLVAKLVTLLNNGQKAMNSIATQALTNGKRAYQAVAAVLCPVFAQIERRHESTQSPMSFIGSFYGSDWNSGKPNIRGRDPQVA